MTLEDETDLDCSGRGRRELRVSWIADAAAATGLGELPAPDGLSTAIIANSCDMYSVQVTWRRWSLVVDASVGLSTLKQVAGRGDGWLWSCMWVAERDKRARGRIVGKKRENIGKISERRRWT